MLQWYISALADPSIIVLIIPREWHPLGAVARIGSAPSFLVIALRTANRQFWGCYQGHRKPGIDVRNTNSYHNNLPRRLPRRPQYQIGQYHTQSTTTTHYHTHSQCQSLRSSQCQCCPLRNTTTHGRGAPHRNPMTQQAYHHHRSLSLGRYQ